LEPAARLHIQFLSATGTVTGSKYLVCVGDRRILIDCGLFRRADSSYRGAARLGVPRAGIPGDARLVLTNARNPALERSVFDLGK
jgi:hypothetical protein